MKAEGEEANRRWDGWMASQTWWTWVWTSSGSWWWTGKPGVLQSMGLQKIGHNWATELNSLRYVLFSWVERRSSAYTCQFFQIKTLMDVFIGKINQGWNHLWSHWTMSSHSLCLTMQCSIFKTMATEKTDLAYELLLSSWLRWSRFSSVQFSHSVVSDSLRPRGLQHARLPCPSPTS